MSQAPSSNGVEPGELRDRLLQLWTLKDLQGLRAEALWGFSALRCPLAGLVEVLRFCPGPQKGRSATLGQLLLGDFQKWRMAQNPPVEIHMLPTEQIPAVQYSALSLISDANSAYMDPLLEIYQLHTLDTHTLLTHTHTLWDQRAFREAAILATKLNLQEHLDMEKMCVPLVLLDKLPLAESYVKLHPHLQEALVSMLDSWCSPHFKLDTLRSRFSTVHLSKHQCDQLQPKLLIKHVFRLMDKFNVDPARCSNSVYKRKLDSLRFLMAMHFKEGRMSEENWSDHVQTMVEGSIDLQVYVVELVVRYGSLQQAAEWARYYKLPRNRLPFGVADTIQTLPPSHSGLPVSVCEDSWYPSPADAQRYYQLPVAPGNVHFLSSLAQLEQCRHAVMQPGVVVGVDMEWRAGFGTGGRVQRVALIQLAVSGSVFLLDLCAARFSQEPITIQLIRDLLSHRDILKLGYGMSGDVRSLVSTWAELSEQPIKLQGMLDLLYVHQKLQMGRRGVAGGRRSVEVHESVCVCEGECVCGLQQSVCVSGGGGGGGEKGLSLMVQQVLGRPLDKQEQLSNWERRPLRQKQIRYAAADAYCLLDVFNALQKDPAHYGLPSDIRSIGPAPPQRKEDKIKDKSRKGRHKKNLSESELSKPADCHPEGKVELNHEGEESTKGEVSSPQSELQNQGEWEGPWLLPGELRVVCDNMLQGLGRYLRCLGVDTLILENTDDHKVAAKLARTQDRVILTSGQPYQTLKSQVGEGRCLSLDCSERARDQAVTVMSHFHVRATHTDIFSRCQACNNDEYLRVPQSNMAQMMKDRG
ncbi:exonuclease mut-7 homolog [Engraulis encrasicolus]|uniref:exonuclease mut-7 homolog n=1 Tax=Engraulis encrasicolus TaxID=184585 RepID=UPI002FCF85BF